MTEFLTTLQTSWVQIAVFVLLVFMVTVGYRKGLIRMSVSFVSYIIALIASKQLLPIAKAFVLKNDKLRIMLQTLVQNIISGSLGMTTTGSDIAGATGAAAGAAAAGTAAGVGAGAASSAAASGAVGANVAGAAGIAGAAGATAAQSAGAAGQLDLSGIAGLAGLTDGASAGAQGLTPDMQDALTQGLSGLNGGSGIGTGAGSGDIVSTFYQLIGLDKFTQYIGEKLTDIIISTILFILLLIITTIIVKLAFKILEMVVCLPGLNFMNRVMGAALGLIEGLLLLWVMIIVIGILPANAVTIEIARQFNTGGTWLYYLKEANVFTRVFAAMAQAPMS